MGVLLLNFQYDSDQIYSSPPFPAFFFFCQEPVFYFELLNNVNYSFILG